MASRRVRFKIAVGIFLLQLRRDVAHGFEQTFEVESRRSRRENDRRVIEKKQFVLHPLAEFAERGDDLGLAFGPVLSVAFLDFLFAHLADGLRHQIPFVDDDDAGFAGFHNFVRNLFVLLGNSRLGIQNQHGNVAALDGIHRALDAVELDRIFHAPRFSHAGGVNENVLLPHPVGFPPRTARQWNRASCPAPG